MSDFMNFALDRGLIISNVIYGKWVRVPTIDRPQSRNGAYFHNIEYAHVQNWATMDSAETWQDGKERQPFEQAYLTVRIKKSREKYNQERARLNRAAIKKAETMLRLCRNDTNVYLASKGFTEMCFNILFEDNKDPLLCVPMRVNGTLSGLQVIAPDGQKKFIYGTNASLATFDIGSGANVFLVEGLATGLSMQKIAAYLKIPYTIRVCFSAGNMAKVAKLHDKPILICDHDKESGTGERVGKESGKRYYMPPVPGDDINDECNRSGYFTVAQKIKKIIYQKLI